MKRTFRIMHIAALAVAVLLPAAGLGRLALRQFYRPAALVVEMLPAAAKAAEPEISTPRELGGTATEIDMGSTPLEPALARLETAVAVQGAAWDATGLAALSNGDSTPAEPQSLAEVSRAERWLVYFAEGITASDYARQIDSLGVELGAIGTTGEIEYAAQLAKPIPDRRVGPAAAESRLYMSWRRGDLAEADRRLLASAGVHVGEKIVVMFFPAAAEEKLAELEKKFAGREPSAILQTRFGVRAAGLAFEFYVFDQTPLK